MHALQPCDVGIFGPLACAWKLQVTQALQDNIPITKDNLLWYYHDTRSTAFKPVTIQAAFRKTGIYPFDHNAVPTSAFEPAKNTMMQAAQPLPAQLPSSLVLTPNPSPAASVAHTLTPHTTPVTSAAPSSPDIDTWTLNGDDPRAPALNSSADASASPIAEPQQVQQYHIEVLPPLPHTASHRALHEENAILQAIIEQVGVELEQDYAQMKLMDLENERLCQNAFAKE